MKVFISSVLLSFTFLSQSHAQESNLAKVGPDIKMISSNSTGLLIGGRYVHYSSPLFYMGGAGYTGQLTDGTSPGSFSYGGFLAGYDRKISKKWSTEVSLLIGGGGGFEGTTQEGGFVLAPTYSLSYLLGERVQAAFTVGYLWMPSSDNFSGLTVGMRFDFR